MAKIMEDDPALQDQVKELEKLYLESSLQSDCIYQIDKAIDTWNELAGTSKTSAW